VITLLDHRSVELAEIEQRRHESVDLRPVAIV
jgi:hypothetical protein